RDEVENLLHLRVRRRALGAYRLDGRRHHTLCVKALISPTDRVKRIASQPRAATADRVVALDAVIAHRRERRNIMGNAFVSRYDHEPPDLHKLMDRRPAAEERALADMHVAAEEHTVRQRHALAYLAIMPGMRRAHEKAAVPDARRVLDPRPRCAVNR